MKNFRLLFSDDMARAIVKGRKTVTRRPVMPMGPQAMQALIDAHGGKGWPCAPGDLLIGREAWGRDPNGDRLFFRADGVAMSAGDHRYAYGKRCHFHGCKYCSDCFAPYMWEVPRVDGWRPPTSLPDAAARIRRRVVSVMVERLQDISEADAVREGFEAVPVHGEWVIGGRETHWSARKPFADTWNAIYAAKGIGWAVNPWVWRIEFEGVNHAG